MTSIKMTFTRQILFLLLLLFSLPCMSTAQVATPSLDHILLVNMPAATGWRKASTAGVTAIRGRGVENKGQADEKEVYWEELSYLIASPVTEVLYTEAFRSIQRRELFEGDKNTEKYEINRDQVNFAFTKEDKYTVGVNYFSSENKLESDQASTFYNEVKEEQTGIGVGTSLKLLGMFYFAAGMEQVEERSSSPSYGNSVIESSWVNQLLGIAIMDPNGDDPVYRIEFSKILSPKVEENDQGKTLEIHHQTDNSRVALEFINKSRELLFRLERQIYTTEKSETEKDEKVYDSFGISRSRPNGWNYGVYIIKEKDSAETFYYRANLFYNF